MHCVFPARKRAHKSTRDVLAGVGTVHRGISGVSELGDPLSIVDCDLDSSDDEGDIVPGMHFAEDDHTTSPSMSIRSAPSVHRSSGGKAMRRSGGGKFGGRTKKVVRAKRARPPHRATNALHSMVSAPKRPPDSIETDRAIELEVIEFNVMHHVNDSREAVSGKGDGGGQRESDQECVE